MLRIKTAPIIALLAGLTLLTPPVSALTGMDDKPASLETLVGKGKWTVVEVWASDCRACRGSIHETINFEAANPDVDVVGISLDGSGGKANAEKFIDEFGLDFTNLLSDPSEFDKYLYSTAKESFIGTPTFMVYNPAGKLLAVQAGAITEEALSAFIKRQEAQGKPAT